MQRVYCKNSFHYWVTLFLGYGVLKGMAVGGDPNWLGKATEWGGKNAQTTLNPITRCYTAREIRWLFGRFENISLRKGEFYVNLIPKIGRLYRRWQARRYGTHPGGYLVYGEPWPIQSPLERRLGAVIGFAWFISATKPR